MGDQTRDEPDSSGCPSTGQRPHLSADKTDVVDTARPNKPSGQAKNKSNEQIVEDDTGYPFPIPFRSSTRLIPVPRWLTLSWYFSPFWFVVYLITLSGGLLLGDSLVPIGGRLIGVLLTAFLIGAGTDTRRYIVVILAGLSLGVTAAIVNNAIISIAAFDQPISIIGATTGMLATVIGYHFGRKTSRHFR